MVLDTSAIVAIFLRESGYEDLEGKIARAPQVLLGAPTLVEGIMVLGLRTAQDCRSHILELLQRWDAHVIPFTDEHCHAAADAFLRYGKGRHPAALNLGDCLTYAVAAVSGQPLLCKGNGFSRTDIRSA